jgi:NADH-quinone oxidoreductase subunit E
MNGTDARAADALPGPPEDEILALLDRLGVGEQSNLIALLQEIQAAFGYLPPVALEKLSQRVRLPLSRIHGVVSFYAQFYTTPRGRHTIRCCRGTACHVRGGRRVIDAVRHLLGVEDGETTADMMFSFETVACLGACALSPVVVVDGVYYGKATPERIAEVLDQVSEDGSGEEEAD